VARTPPGGGRDIAVNSKRDATGRAEVITLEGEGRAVLRGWDFKIIAGRSLGWQMIKSSRFEVTRAGNEFVFRGSGFGHGLGLCQEGAHVMATRGMDHRRIIDHYFPGVRLNILNRLVVPASYLSEDFKTSALDERAPGSGDRRSLSSEHFHVAYPVEVEREKIDRVLRILEGAYLGLNRRLLSASLKVAENAPFEIVIHATTEDFIAATGQSGWAAGATRGRKIELQPVNVLERRGALIKTLQHELAHAFIEVLGKGRTPRWLAEGMAIYLAGEGSNYSQVGLRNKMSREELERRLSKPAPVRVMKELYAAAYREVFSIIQAEGEAGVWWMMVNQLEKIDR